jgi:hypothetical protein
MRGINYTVTSAEELKAEVAEIPNELLESVRPGRSIPGSADSVRASNSKEHVVSKSLTADSEMSRRLRFDVFTTGTDSREPMATLKHTLAAQQR